MDDRRAGDDGSRTDAGVPVDAPSPDGWFDRSRYTYGTAGLKDGGDPAEELRRIRPPGRRARRNARLGIVSCALAAIGLIVVVSAIVSGANQLSVLATVLAWLAIASTVAAVGTGAFAVVTNRGRRLGVVGMTVGTVANPLVQIAVLTWFGGS